MPRARASVPSVESQRPSGPLSFLQPTPPETDDRPSPSDLPSGLLSESPSDPWEDASPSGSDELSDEPTDLGPDDPTSSTGSSAGSGLAKAALRRAMRKAVVTAGQLANEFLARDEPAQAVELYVADDDDAKSIGDPAANLMHRHAGLPTGNPDVADALAALFGLAGYAAKQFAKARRAKLLRAQFAPEVTVPLDADVPSTPYTPAP